MLLSELIGVFNNKYKLECLLRKVQQINFIPAEQALMLSIACSDIQKDFGVMELAMTVNLVAGTGIYSLNQSVIDINNVLIGSNGNALIKKSTNWIEKQLAIVSSPVMGTSLVQLPEYFSILYNQAIPQIWVFPVPSLADTITVNYKPNFNLFSPSQATAGDFGNFGITTIGFSGNTVFPTQYDKLIVFGMLMQVFPDYEIKFQKERILLKNIQFSGEKLDYNFEYKD